jgi:uncharacterized membrane protein
MPESKVTAVLFVLTLLSALGCGLIAGVFFAFSAFVMKALARLPAAQGIAAMQSINIAVINPLFLSAFLGTAAACALLVVSALVWWNRAAAVYLLAGGLLYLGGTLLVTIVFNIPRNNALAAVEASSAGGSTLWAQYVNSWTAWNHVRTAAALAATASLTIALAGSLARERCRFTVRPNDYQVKAAFSSRGGETKMQKITYSSTMNAPRDKIWKVMLEDATYRQWTSAFQEGSYAVTDWKEGSKALFLTPEGNGMVSRIVAHRPNEFLSIAHLGTVKSGVEDTASEEGKAWAGAHETYTLRDVGGVSMLTVEMDVTDEYRKYFDETWPKALSKLKALAES